jgi:site-specific DNA-methyltransferase (adenine-specific)/adenine-specific DNA-methyltransferase
MKLSRSQIETITKLLKEGKPLPENYKNIFFPVSKKEYELIYAGKEREEDVLSETMAVPLQPVKTFGENGKDWVNKLIFGDNLQVLKTLMDDSEIKGKIKLIYIDPPFATKQEFRGSRDQKAYQDKIVGARFIEFLRKRIIFLRELLSNDGSIYVHLDWKKSHYLKVVLDEVFQENNFRNEIIWFYPRGGDSEKQFNRKHDTIYYYTKGENWTFNYNDVLIPYNKDQLERFKHRDIKGKYYWNVNPRGERVKTYLRKDGIGEYDVWTIGIDAVKIKALGYPTQKPEALIERIIKASSNQGDLVMDCFCGSGTTLAVAEKLGRRWIGVDCGKLAIYVTQKRLLKLHTQDTKKVEKQIEPFTLYNAGLYDYQKIKTLSWEEYKVFALRLFQCRDEKHTVAKIELDGYLGCSDVLVFNYQKHKDVVLDRGFIDDLHSALGDKISDKFFIISPAANVKFLEDYIQRDKIKYYVLRIPYSIINELHQKDFQAIKQPADEMDVNNTVEAVGFDFIQIPEVECEYFLEKPKKKDLLSQNKECVIKIKKFESQIISKKPLVFKNRETLSMIMLDYDYDGKVFDIDDVFYAESLQIEDYEVRFDKDKIKGEMMIIYVDIFGNEKREIKKLTDFRMKK